MPNRLGWNKGAIPRKFKIILNQDKSMRQRPEDMLTLETATSLLRDIFHLTNNQCRDYAIQAHLEGNATVFVSSKEVVETKFRQAGIQKKKQEKNNSALRVLSFRCKPVAMT